MVPRDFLDVLVKGEIPLLVSAIDPVRSLYQHNNRSSGNELGYKISFDSLRG
jgi:hypothetical protein